MILGTADTGFSLVELITAIVILSVLLLVAGSYMPAGVLGGSLDIARTEQSLLADLRRARSRAMACGDQRRLIVSTQSDGWTIDASGSGMTPCAPAITRRFEDSLSLDAPGEIVFAYPHGGLAGDPPQATELALSDSQGGLRLLCILPETGSVIRDACP